MYKPKKKVLKNGIKWEVCFHVDGKDSKRIRRRFDKKIDAEVFIKQFFTKEISAENVEVNPSNRTLRTES